MTREEIRQMYLEWAFGADETIRQSDVMCACYENGFSYNEIAEMPLTAEEKRKFGTWG